MGAMHAPYRTDGSATTALVVRKPTAPIGAAQWVSYATTAVATVLMGVFGGAAAAVGTVSALTLVHRLIWNPSVDAADAVTALPFPVVHDRNDAMAFGANHRVLAVIVRLREFDAAIVGALPKGVNARVSGTELTLTGKLRSRTQLASLLTTWGVAVHGRVGIMSVEVAWSRTSGPPMSL